jgi:hypothetical protein
MTMEAFVPDFSIAASAGTYEGHGGRLTHHPDLVERLTAEHWRMLALWHDAIVLFGAGNTVRCVDALGRLAALAREHTLHEQTLLFAYLEQELPEEDERRPQLHALRAGWPGLREALAKATRDVAAVSPDAAERTALARRLDALAETFRHRFDEEQCGPFVSYAPTWNYALTF